MGYGCISSTRSPIVLCLAGSRYARRLIIKIVDMVRELRGYEKVAQEGQAQFSTISTKFRFQTNAELYIQN